ncbi:GNAT family N-acetyltransferase [Paraburkholderia sp. BCC1884]|uniref:GNAT family N-acetyltransferase n=1 Tax=Paraburkholderia sp. BCC1884 TaxID=2562668 RepID=UPI0021B43144|nr:GNAT family N-acetyltransferase [Paraburkholderia sp. BCC1884]
MDRPAVVSLRASTAADREFLRAVFFSTRIDEFAASGLSAGEVEALLAQQFDMQDSYYRRHYPAGRFDVVMAGETAVGRLYHDWQRGRGLNVIDIALLPDHRGAGIGTRLMRALVGQAVQAGLAVNLYVEVNNPVQSLYRRMGFVKCGENGIYESLRREAVPFDSPAEPLPGLQPSIVE